MTRLSIDKGLLKDYLYNDKMDSLYLLFLRYLPYYCKEKDLSSRRILSSRECDKT